tara:strand:+ start:484 stop:843 length:360 start_codon:yes stop_codon:yes gene_type:complete
MDFNNKLKKTFTTKSKSTIIKLQDESKITDPLLVLISSLTLEEIIAIKFELSCSDINNRLYGFDMWRSSSKIMKEAVLRFALSSTTSKSDTARFLGITYSELKMILKVYDLKDYFNVNK